MNAHVQQLLEELRRLTPDERCEILTEFQFELDERDIAQVDDPLWDAEIAKRVARVESGESSGVSWEVAQQTIFGPEHESPRN